jgi:hypothetical protein
MNTAFLVLVLLVLRFFDFLASFCTDKEETTSTPVVVVTFVFCNALWFLQIGLVWQILKVNYCQ